MSDLPELLPFVFDLFSFKAVCWLTKRKFPPALLEGGLCGTVPGCVGVIGLSVLVGVVAVVGVVGGDVGSRSNTYCVYETASNDRSPLLILTLLLYLPVVLSAVTP